MFLKDRDMLPLVALIVLTVLLSKPLAVELIYELPGTYTAADTSFRLIKDMEACDYVFWLNVRDTKEVYPFVSIMDNISNAEQGIVVDNREISTMMSTYDLVPAGYGEKMYILRKFSGATRLYRVSVSGELDTIFSRLGGDVYIKELRVFRNSDTSSNTTLRDLKIFRGFLKQREIDSLRTPPVQVLRVSTSRSKPYPRQDIRMFTVNGRLVNTRLNLPNDWGFYVISTHNRAVVANRRLFTSIVGN